MSDSSFQSLAFYEPYANTKPDSAEPHTYTQTQTQTQSIYVLNVNDVSGWKLSHVVFYNLS